MSAPERPTESTHRLSRAERECVLAEVLSDYPAARVVAIARSALFVPMPPEVPLTGQVAFDGAVSMLDVVEPSQARTVMNTWERMLAHGAASAWLPPLADEAPMAVHFIDMLDCYRVVIGVLTGYVDTGRRLEPVPLLPRTAFVRKNELSIMTTVDDAAVSILGWPAEELVGRRTQDLIHPDDEEYAVAAWLRMLTRPGSTSRMRLRHRHRDGSWRWLEVTNHNNLADPAGPHVLGELIDVTAEVEAVNALRTNERLLRRLTEALPTGVLYIEPDRKISYGNGQLGALVGVTGAEHIDAALEHLARRERPAVMAAIDAALTLGKDADLEVSFHPPQTRRRRCLLSLRPVAGNDDSVAGAITCLIDITDDADRREDLERRVRYDPLTACLNHESIMAELRRQLDDRWPGYWTVVVFVDLDDFKETNDRFGHVDGDRLLKHVAAQLSQEVGEDGLVGRVGGDEFLVVLRMPAEAGPRAGNGEPEALVELGARVARALGRPVVLSGGSFAARASIGLAYACAVDTRTRDAAELVAAADAAMYESKRRGDALPVVAPHAV